MKYIIIFISVFTLSITACKAQIITIEDFSTYSDSQKEKMSDGTYIKDVNGVLNKFIGTWKGIYNSNNYEFKIIKKNYSWRRIKSR